MDELERLREENRQLTYANAELRRLLDLARQAVSEDARMFRELGDGLSRILEQLEEIDLASGSESKGVERLRALRNRIPE